MNTERLNQLMPSILALFDVFISARGETHVLQSTCQRLLDSGLFAAAWVACPGEGGSAQIVAKSTATPLGLRAQRWRRDHAARRTMAA